MSWEWKMNKFGFSTMSFTTVLVSCLLGLTVFILVSMTYENRNFGGFAEPKIRGGQDQNAKPSDAEIQGGLTPTIAPSSVGAAVEIFGQIAKNATPPAEESDSFQPNRTQNATPHGGLRVPAPRFGVGIGSPPPISTPKPNGDSHGGLFATGFKKGTCRSRYQSILLRKSPHIPSSHLVSRMRNYEKIHKQCGPYTYHYKTTIEKLKSGRAIDGNTKCKYVVWIGSNGLGNRMISMIAVFLYALLTNRVLLVRRETAMADLYCEPFPKSSWLLPKDFPSPDQLRKINTKYADSYGFMIKNNIINASMRQPPPSLLYHHLAHRAQEHDEDFFCDQDQEFLKRVPWLIIQSDQYFVPALFLIPVFKPELTKLFPEKDTVFHHLGRYLFNPSNKVWELITKFHQAHLAMADERIGIQVRVFKNRTNTARNYMSRIQSCTLTNNLLPAILSKKSASPPLSQSSKSVLITSLDSVYYEYMQEKYGTKPTVTGEVISFHQPSHEGHQKFGDNVHNMKAWTEMYLLSLCEVLVTSPRSTFGYVAQGLGGLKPWILHKKGDEPCSRDISMEPCYHYPPSFKCIAGIKDDPGAFVPHVRHCEDDVRGLTVVND